MFPWSYQQQRQPQTPRELFLRRLREGVPRDLACRASGIKWDDVKEDAEVDMALAEGEIVLFERARDNGVTGTIRAAMRHETATWNSKAEAAGGETLEDLLRE